MKESKKIIHISHLPLIIISLCNIPVYFIKICQPNPLTRQISFWHSILPSRIILCCITISLFPSIHDVHKKNVPHCLHTRKLFFNAFMVHIIVVTLNITLQNVEIHTIFLIHLFQNTLYNLLGFWWSFIFLTCHISRM